MAAEWPPQLPALKADMGIDASDERDDARLQTVLDAAVAFVQRARRGTGVGRVNFDGLVNVNTADLTDLQTLPGVDAALAQAVVDGRPYRTLQQFGNVVGSTVYAGINDLVTLAGDVDDDLVLGTLRLAGRYHTRRRAPDDLIAAAEMGTNRLPGLDPDITRLLRLSRHQAMAVG